MITDEITNAEQSDSVITRAIEELDNMSSEQSDGGWLEELTANVAPYLKEWDIGECWGWDNWDDRKRFFPNTTKQDIGIDAIAKRRSDGKYIALQCKARMLDANGEGLSINKEELNKFAAASAGSFWAERWVVTNGNNPMTNNAIAVASMGGKPIKSVNIDNDLRQQEAANAIQFEECLHCEPNPDGEERIQTRDCMQAEAIRESVRILRQHEQSDSGGLPVGQARGKIILPCGTGKTRIAQRIIEELTPFGGLSIVLCPSIALVAQIRREFLMHSQRDIRALAVCSDVTAGYDPKKEGTRDTAKDPTLDTSNVSEYEVKGQVTTNADEIADWIRDGHDDPLISVIFGTYQSGGRVAEALQATGVTARVLIADEAHRTAGLRRRKKSNGSLSAEDQKLYDFTLCHNNDAFPATYRVYQTATPRIYDVSSVSQDQPSDWVVRTMDDETVFGVELYRKTYVEAVNNEWLSDYRIIAMGVNDSEAYQQAMWMAKNTKSKGTRRLATPDYLRGLAFALAMGGATQSMDNASVPIKSCIAFMNTVDKSKNMAQDLQTDAVKNWVQDWLHENANGKTANAYTLEHLDASSNASARDNAKVRLAKSSEANPHGVINVGIFGEGTDAPSLSAVAFLEPRKSPIDVIQAVGRAMRRAPGKEMGYIICPIEIPHSTDPEEWLTNSTQDEGWKELGQILLALRAHDSRIESELENRLAFCLPKVPEVQQTIVAIANREDKRISYRMHQGAPGKAIESAARVINGQSTLIQEFHPMPEQRDEALPWDEMEPTQIITGKKNSDGSTEFRTNTVVRVKPVAGETRGVVDIKKSKAKAKDMINKGVGVPITPAKKPGLTSKERSELHGMQMLLLSGMKEYGSAIKMNLLAKSGLANNRVLRDLNILESSINEASHQLRNDGLLPVLDSHFGLNNLNPKSRNNQADGCTTAALLMMNAAMLHQRIANGRWLQGVSDLALVKNDVNVVRRFVREWNAIMKYDFWPVLEPALKSIEAVEDTGKQAGLERALRHIASEAERIAETYADMGADHAGPLFNKVMGNQASDGAFFTRPVSASIAARLTLDACGDVNWRDQDVWREHKTVDLACGSGTLLAAMLTDMKRRAREQGADEQEIGQLQKVGVEETIKGLDINPVSLQLAASQLTAGNQSIRYRKMGLHLMPHGPSPNNPTQVSVGTLELLGQKAIVPRSNELDIPDDSIGSMSVWSQSNDVELENATEDEGTE